MHVVWDWNGTLLDDLHVVLAAVNEGVSEHRDAPVSLEDYRDSYTRPVKRFYDSLFGYEVSESVWREIDRRFHDAYRQMIGSVRLAGDAIAALDLVVSHRASQSLLSMYPHAELVPVVRSHGIEDRFTRVDGLRGEPGDRKSAYLAAHLGALGLAPDETVVIGDTPDDADAARSVGSACVLYDGGSHHRRELEATGAPIAGSLVQAAMVALDVV